MFDICKMILSGNNDNQIHKEYPQVSTSTIFNIRKGKQYYDIAIQYHGMKEYIEEKIKSLSA